MTRSRSSSTRSKAATHEIVDQLHGMVNELIKENRQLKRQLDRIATRGSAAATSAVERGLKTLQRRVERALSGTTTSTRKRASAPARTRRTTTARSKRGEASS